MATIGKVRAVFTASTSGLVAGVNQAAGSMRRLESSVGSLRSGMGALVAIQGAQLFGSIANAAGGYIRSLVSMGQAQADVIDQQSKLAARVGMTYGEFSGLALAGDLAGVGMDTIATAATKADIAFVKAQNGSKTAQKAFSGLGLSMEDLGGMSAAERFQAIASAIAQLPTEAQRSAAAVQLFGRAGAQLLPLFAGGAEGIAEAAAQAERLGLNLTTAQGQDVEAMNDAFTLAGKAVQGVVQQVVAYLAPAVKAVADTFTNLVGSIGGANIGQAIGDGILVGARFLAGIGDYLIANLGSVFSYLSEVGSQWNAVVDFMNRAGNFIAGVFNSAEAGLGLIVLAFTGSFEVLAKIAQQIGGYLGFDTSSIDSIVAGAVAFNDELSSGINANINAAASNFSAALSSETSNAAGQAIAGPLTTALDAAVAQANASANQVETAGKGAAVAITEAAAIAAEPALKGVDSRSSEGISEMFRLMRGTGDDVQEQQLGVLEEIRDAISSQEDDYPFAIEGG
jgi:hypothetical protein